MQPKTIIFIGPQGSGKGTQVDELKKYLTEHDTEHDVNHVETGKPFRQLAKTGGYTAEVVKGLIDQGKFVPDVLTNAFVIKEFVDQHTKAAHIILDGYPRNEAQAKACNELFALYGRERIDVIHLDTAEEIVIERMLDRGRADDTEETIAKRLQQYHEVTEPLLSLYDEQDNAVVHTIDGGKTVDEVREQILQVLELAP